MVSTEIKGGEADRRVYSRRLTMNDKTMGEKEGRVGGMLMYHADTPSTQDAVIVYPVILLLLPLVLMAHALLMQTKHHSG